MKNYSSVFCSNVGKDNSIIEQSEKTKRAIAKTLNGIIIVCKAEQ